MAEKTCSNCGATVDENKRFCTECGTKQVINSADPATNPPEQPANQQSPQQNYGQPVQQQAYQPQHQQPYAPQYPPEIHPGKTSEYEPISTLGYIGIFILFCIPVIGFILTIVWACGGCRKINKRNLCRAMLIIMLITAIISVILYFTFYQNIQGYFNEFDFSSAIDTMRDFLPID